MRRREVLAGAAALAVAGGGAAIATTDWTPWTDGADVSEHELPSIEAPGSAAGTVVVPERGAVSVVEVFATWCGVCADVMDPLGAVVDDLEDDVQFVSVTNEPLGGTRTHEDVADWWADHDGRWPVAHDEELDLTRELEAASVPYTVVLDAENAISWRHSGYLGADELRAAIEAAADGSSMD